MALVHWAGVEFWRWSIRATLACRGRHLTQQFNSTALVALTQSVLPVTLQLKRGLPLRVVWKLFSDEHECQRLFGLGHERLQTLPALVELLGECLFFHE